MRTTKCLVTLGVIALTGIAATLTTGQDTPATPSNTRQASCIVRITVDPAIMPLNPETVSALIHSPAVLFKAARDVLSLNTPEDLERLQEGGRSPLSFNWLSSSAVGASPTGPFQEGMGDAYDDPTMRQLEEAYGREYMQMMMGGPGQNEKGETQQDPTRGSSQKDGGFGTGRGRSRTGGMAGGGMGGFGAMGGAYGGVAGGVGGGMGMGGFGGAMGGRGGRSGYGAASGLDRQAPGTEQSATIEVRVALPDTLPPRADEFLRAVTKNLQTSLSRAYDGYMFDLRYQLDAAKNQSREAEAALRSDAGDSPGSQRVKEQLDQIVDLSALSPRTPYAEAFEILEKSVAPPLDIVPLWRDLTEMAYVDPTSPIEIDGMSSVRLGTALDLLLKGSRSFPTDPQVVYQIRDSVIVVGTRNALQPSSGLASERDNQVDVRALAAQRNELARSVQSLELDLGGMEARREAITEQIQNIRQAAQRKLGGDPITQELEKLIQVNTQALASIRKQVDSGRLPVADLAKAEESLTRAKIELARRQEELSQQTGAGQLEQYNSDLSRIAIDQAEKRAQLEILRKQLDEVQRQLTQASTFDPSAARTRIAQESLEIINRRLVELENRLATLQPPTVVMIGAN